MEAPKRHGKAEIVLEEYGAMLQPHLESSGGLLGLLPSNPELYPAQEYECYRIKGEPQAADTIEIFANRADARFPRYIESLQSPESQKIIQTAGEFMKSGGNIILLTNHGSFIDIAMAMAGQYCALDRSGFSPHTGIILNKTVSRAGYILEEDAPIVPATDVLKFLCNDVYLSFPRTESMMKSKISKFFSDDVKDHNRRIRKDITERLSEGGYMLAVAGSGATDKAEPGNPGIIRMGSLSDGMIQLMTKEDKKKPTLVLPMAVWLEGNEAVYEFCSDIPKAVTSKEEAHGLMRQISSRLNRIVPDKKFQYTAESR